MIGPHCAPRRFPTPFFASLAAGFAATLLGCAGLLLSAAPASAQSFGESLQNGTVSAQLRLHYEHADIEGGTDAAESLTLRTRLGYRTGEFADSNAFLQFEDVSALIRNYAPLDEDYDQVNDPEGSSVHQAYFQYDGVTETQLRVGRQELQYENGRYMAVSNWRQQGQSFDAVSIETNAVSGFKFAIGDAWRLLGSGNTFTDVDSFVFLIAEYDGIESHQLFVHGFLLDSPGGKSTDRDSATYGVRFVGNPDFAEYFAQYDVQTGYADNSDNGGYLLDAFVAAKFAGFRVGPGYNVITGASGSDHPFDTLLGTTHAFSGYADAFTSSRGGGLTPGLTDTYGLLGGTHAQIKWAVIYHSFEQEVSSDPYGTEIDVVASRPIVENLTGLVEFAQYTADSGNDTEFGAADITKYWVRLDYKF